MTDRFLLLRMCLAMSIAYVFAAPVGAQQNDAIVLPLVGGIIQDDAAAEIVEAAPSEIYFSNALKNFEVETNQPQCFTVKSSALGCMEGITILPQDEVWLVNARACVCGEADTGLLTVSRLVGSNLVPSDISELTAAHDSSDDLATVLYIHGNQTNEEFAIARGLQVYRNAFTTKAHCHGAVRYVIWAWKSEQEKTRLYPDYMIKSKRSVLLGETFAATLNQFSDRNLVVFGYSLGVQVALSAFDSPMLLHRNGDSTLYQVAFAAPAINADYVASHGLSVGGRSPIAKTYVFTNRKDRAIRAAQAIIRRKSPSDEPTIAGLSNAGKLSLGSVTSMDVFEETGPFHSIERYTRSETLQNTMATLLNSVSANRLQTIVVSE